MKIIKYLNELACIFIYISIILNNQEGNANLLTEHLLATFIGYSLIASISLISYKYTKRQLLGIGDSKVFALSGALLGITGLFNTFFFAFITAGVFSFMGKAIGKLKKWQAFPFAPFICIAIEIVWNLGKEFSFVK